MARREARAAQRETGSVLVTIGVAVIIVISILLGLVAFNDQLFRQSKQDSIRHEFSAIGQTVAWGVESWMNRLFILTQAEAGFIALEPDGDHLGKQRFDPHMDDSILASYYGDLDGQLFTSPGQNSEIRFDPSAESWFTHSAETGHGTVSGPFNEGRSGDVAVTFAAPVFRGGDLQGVLANDVGLTGIGTLLERQVGNGIDVIFLFDKNGTVIAHSGIAQAEVNLERVLGGETLMISPGVKTLTLGGQRLIATFRRIGNPNGDGWYIGMMADYDKVFADVNAFRQSAALAILLASILLILALGFVIRRLFVAPIIVADDRAEAASVVKSDFIKTLGHHVRGPINGIMSISDHLKSSSLKEEQYLLVDTIHKTGTSLLGILNDVADFTELQDGELSIRQEEFQVQELVEDIASVLSPAAFEKRIELLVRCDPQMPVTLFGDRQRMRQVLTALLLNAIKRTPRGHVLVSVNAAMTDGVCELSISVSDTGIDLTPEKINAILADTLETDVKALKSDRGRDLGLSVISRLIRAMGGDLVIVNQPEGGVLATVRLNLKAPSQAPADLLATHSHLSGLQVLIVDDNEISRRIEIERLRAWGMIPVAVESVGQAKLYLGAGLAGKLPFDLLYTRRRLADGKGLDLAADLRRTEGFGDLPILVRTSGPLGEIDGQARTLTNVQAVQMPVRAKDLSSALRRLIAQNSVSRLDYGLDRPERRPVSRAY